MTRLLTWQDNQFQVDTLEIRNCEVSARRTDEDHHGVRWWWWLWPWLCHHYRHYFIVIIIATIIIIVNSVIDCLNLQHHHHTWQIIDMTAFNTDGFDVSGKNVWIHDCQIWNQVKKMNNNGHFSWLPWWSGRLHISWGRLGAHAFREDQRQRHWTGPVPILIESSYSQS